MRKIFFHKPVPVLMYHRINHPDSNSSLTISPENFAQQMDWLEKSRFHFLSLDEVVDRQGKIPLWERSVALTFDDGFQDNRENAFSLLIKRGRTAALFVVVNWVGKEGHLGWDEIRELSQLGILIGSHSLSHRWLPEIPSDEELQKEVVDSKKRIEDEIGKEVRHFSYPVGGTDQRAAEWVKRAGYRAAWVAGARPSYTASRDPRLTLRRIKVGPSDANPLLFSIKALGLKSLFH